MVEVFRQFEIDEARLSAREKEVVKRLVAATKLAGSLYALQENNEYPGANFYPRDASPAEIENAAKVNPLILDPYTVVERDASGALVPIPYHEKYREPMGHISELLQEAAELSEEPSFAEYLRARAQSFLDDSWDESETKWLEVGESRLDILIGPIEPYLDNLFSVKCAFQGNVRIRSEDERFNPKDYLRVICNLHPTSPAVLSKGGGKRVQVRVDDVIALAGWHARLCPVGTNLPNDPEKVARYGTKIIIYTTDIRLREGRITLPVFERLFPKKIVKKHSAESFLDNAIRATMLHEITEAAVKYPGAVERLGDMYTPVKELHASIIGIKSCTFHVLKGILSQQDFEEILMVFISWLFETWLRVEASRGIKSYLDGYIVAFNFFKEYGGLKVKGGRIVPDFENLFVCLEGLSGVLSHLMCSGTRAQARKFFDQYGSRDFLGKLATSLKDIAVDF